MNRRVTPITLAQGLSLTASQNVPSNGSDVAAYDEGVLFMLFDVTYGTWTVSVQSYDESSLWLDIKDAFGAATAKVFTAGAGQSASWQLTNFGKHLRVKFSGVGADQVATIQSLIFLGKG
jgi:hypothetical protein